MLQKQYKGNTLNWIGWVDTFPIYLCFMMCDVRSARSFTPGSSCLPCLSSRRWASQRARCPSTVWTWGTLLCEYRASHNAIAPKLHRLRALVITSSASENWNGPRLMFCFSFHFQKKQRFEWKSTQEATISSPRTVCKGKYLILFYTVSEEKSHIVFFNVVCFRLQTPTVTLERFLEAMDQAVDKQKEEKANLVNGVWTYYNAQRMTHDCSWALNPLPCLSVVWGTNYTNMLFFHTLFRVMCFKKGCSS